MTDNKWPRSSDDHWKQFEDTFGPQDDDHLWSYMESEEFQHELEAEMENWWAEVVDYAAELELPIQYIEEEFVILGELIKHKD